MEQQNIQWKQYVSALAKWWWLIVISAVVAGVVSYLATQAQPRQYYAGVTLMVGSPFRDTNPNAGEFSTSQALAQSYADIATREPVLRGVLDALNLPWDIGTLHDKVSARVVAGTQLVQISVIDTDQQRAFVLAKTMSDQLILQGPNASSLSASDRQLIHDQIENIKANLNRAYADSKKIDSQIASAQTGREIQTAEGQRTVLQQQMSLWQTTLVGLLNQVQTVSPNSLAVIEPAALPTAPIGPNWPQNVVLAVVFALLLSVAAAMLFEFLDDTLKSRNDVRQTLKLDPIGAIARFQTGKDRSQALVVTKAPLSGATEAYRSLCLNLQFKAVGRPLTTLTVTSSTPMEGKSTTAANLAAMLAKIGNKVILIDADFRRPSVHRIFELDENALGLTDALLDERADLSNYLLSDVEPNLSILPAGSAPPNPAELLNSERMRSVMDELKRRADIVIIDTPPVLGLADAAAVAGMTDAVLLVVEAGRTRRGVARASVEALTSVGATILGVVLNRAEEKVNATSYYYYQHGSRLGKGRDKTKGGRKGTRQDTGPALQKLLPTSTNVKNGNGHSNGHANGSTPASQPDRSGA